MTDDTFPATLSAVAIRAYVNATGWTEGPQGSHGSVFERDGFKACVPHEDDDPDAIRMALYRLAQAERRTPEETAAAVAEYRDARGPVASVSAPAAESPAHAPAERSGTATGLAEGSDEAADEPHMLLLEMAFGIIANAGWDAFSGNVDLPKTTGWHEAAIRWRDDYHGWLDLHSRPGGWQSWEELAVSVTRERDAFLFENGHLKRALRDATSGTAAAMKEPEHWRESAEAAEARLAEIRQAIAAFLTHHGNSAAFALRSARDLAEGIRQVLDRAALEAPGGGTGEPAP